jgi:hypothetical protein
MNATSPTAYLAQSTLPMTLPDRLRRAKAQGFDIDTTWYHGTTPAIGESSVDILAFDPNKIGDKYWADKVGFFFTSSTVLASYYAETNSIGRNVLGGAIYPVFLSSNTPLVVDDEMAAHLGVPSPRIDGVISCWDDHQAILLAAAKKGFHDSVELIDSENEQRMKVVFSPVQTRSIHASFDPKHRGKANLLGHEITIPSPPTKEKEYTFDAHETKLLALVTLAHENYKQLTLPQYVRKLLEPIQSELGDWARTDKVGLMRLVAERDHDALSDENKMKAIIGFCQAIVVLRQPTIPVGNTVAPSLINEPSISATQRLSRT